MGCGVSSGGSELRDARGEVEALRRRLDEAESERARLRRQVKALEQERSEQAVHTAPEAAGDAAQEKLAAPGAAEASPALAACQGPGVPGTPEAITSSEPASGAFRPPEVPGTVEEIALPGSPEVLPPTVGIVPPPAVAEVHDSAEVSLVRAAAEPGGDHAPEAATGQTIGRVAPEEDLILPAHLAPQSDKSCTSPRTPSIVQTGELSESQSESAGEPGSPPKVWLQSPGQESVEGKLTHSMDSKASTCTPGPQKVNDPLRCHQCGDDGLELFQDPSDLNNYCDRCWADFYGQPPQRCEVQPLVLVEVFEIWQDGNLAQLWATHVLPGWPPPVVHPVPAPPAGTEGEVWSKVNVRVRRDVVGPHARDQTSADSLQEGELVAGKYRIRTIVGQGHFTKAYLADDTASDCLVCLKRHRCLTVEALSDLMAIGHRMEEVDPGGLLFPRLLDAFFDYVCITVESLVEGQNCLSLAQSCPGFFLELSNLRVVAQGVLLGLSRLDRAGIVHNDVKPDNLMWVGDIASSGSSSPSSAGGGPRVLLVDFGCARLDQREENGRNWSLAEGGAGHLGKWSPEMALRLPITHQGDVWGMAISLCELHCGRCVWRNEADTAEIVLAQSIGLCDLHDGIPASLLRRSPLDVRQLYTPAPRHFPLRRNTLGQLEALRPARWGLEQVLGEDWRDAGKGELRGLLLHALVIDPAIRPSAAQLMECCRFVNSRPREQEPAEGAASPV